MNKTAWIIIGLVVIVAVYAVSIQLWKMGVNKDEISKANIYDAQSNVVETQMDNMINTIVNQFKVNKKFAKDFIAVAVAQSAGRKGGGLFKSSTEAANKLGVPENTYLKMMNSIEGKLNEFKGSQDLLTSMWNKHKDWCQDPFHNNPFFALGMGPSLESKVKEKPVMISSSSVKEAVETKTFDGTKLIPDTE